MAYSRYRISHKKELYYIFCIVAVAAILLLSFLGPGGYRELRKAQLEVQLQRARVNDIKRSNGDRMKSIESLRSDPEALEKYAREKGYGRAGDIVQELPREPEKKDK
jgi:cell division protein FtsB